MLAFLAPALPPITPLVATQAGVAGLVCFAFALGLFAGYCLTLATWRGARLNFDADFDRSDR